MKTTTITLCVTALSLVEMAFASRLSERLAGEHEDFLENRRGALPGLSDPYGIPPVARVVRDEEAPASRSTSSQWKRDVVATVFWVGEKPTANNPTPNNQSAWDQNWEANFGGCDDPDHRSGWCPAGMVPQLNPFYVALPYNDVAPGGVHRPEAPEVIPWFWENFRGDGISVCKGRWVAIHSVGRVCYAQWEDVGPFETDHWQYVFGDQAPRANRNQSAGIDISPAVRDFLNLRSGERVQWRFVTDRQVPQGPWRDWTTDPSPTPRKTFP